MPSVFNVKNVVKQLIWTRMGVFIPGYSASPIFYNIKKTETIITSLSLAPAPPEQTVLIAAPAECCRGQQDIC
jgi:hypothetical protein